MTITQHTPGPWDVQNKGNLFGKYARCEVVQGVNVDGSKNLPTIVRMPDLSVTSYANAHLIAAAPELLAIAEQVLRIFGGHSGRPGDTITGIEFEQRDNLLVRLQAIIQKARDA